MWKQMRITGINLGLRLRAWKCLRCGLSIDGHSLDCDGVVVLCEQLAR